MRIAMVYSTGFPPVEGIGRHVYNLSKQLIERGHEVILLTRGAERRSVGEDDGLQVEILPHLPIYPFHVTLQKFLAKRVLRDLERLPDLVHIHTPNAPFLSLGAPVVTTFHSPIKIDTSFVEVVDLISLGTRVLAGFTVLNEYQLIKASAAMAAVSHSVANELTAYGVPPGASTVVGNGVNTELFSPRTSESGTSTPPYLLFVGRLAYRKGLIPLIRAAEILAEEGQPLHMKVVGAGPLANQLKDTVRKHGLTKKVQFMGYVPDHQLVGLYSDALATVIPSTYESGPLVMLEAMACGCPVISTPVGMAPEVMGQASCGILLPRADARAIVDAAHTLFSDAGLKERMGAEARELMTRGYTWSRVADRVEGMYRKALDSWPPN